MTRHLLERQICLILTTASCILLLQGCGGDDDDSDSSSYRSETSDGDPKDEASSPLGDSVDSEDDAGSSVAGTATRLCERLDECNVITDLGHYSVTECAEARSACVDELIGSAQTDWSSLVGDCLDLATCQFFLDCYASTPTTC